MRIHRWWPGVLFAALGSAANASWADSFILGDGSKISGEVIQGFSHTIMVKSAGGTTVPLALDSIQLVQIDLRDNTQAVGQLLSWKEGVFQILVNNNRLIHVAGGEVMRLEELPRDFEEKPPIWEELDGLGSSTQPEGDPPAEVFLRRIPL